jgi:ATP-dependent Clp protease adaptor protein ClpS
MDDTARHPPASGFGAGATETLPGRVAEAAPETVPETAPETALARPWNVIVHDDPVTLMSYVTAVFMKVFRYERPRAHSLMMEVHTQGSSIVWTGDRERAETYLITLHGYHLLATMDQVDD